MSKKRIRAKLMEAAPNGVKCFPYEWVLPATADTYEQMVEQMAHGVRVDEEYLWSKTPEWQRDIYRNTARAALRAIGSINQPKKGRP